MRGSPLRLVTRLGLLGSVVEALHFIIITLPRVSPAAGVGKGPLAFVPATHIQSVNVETHEEAGTTTFGEILLANMQRQNRN